MIDLVFAPVGQDECRRFYCIDLGLDRICDECLVQCLGVMGEVFVCV